jgi:hypothetical protein
MATPDKIPCTKKVRGSSEGVTESAKKIDATTNPTNDKDLRKLNGLNSTLPIIDLKSEFIRLVYPEDG